jgi:hypothetical protein
MGNTSRLVGDSFYPPFELGKTFPWDIIPPPEL